MYVRREVLGYGNAIFQLLLRDRIKKRATEWWIAPIYLVEVTLIGFKKLNLSV